MRNERPTKIECALAVAKQVARRSHDEETKVGAVLLNEEGTIVATGYNSFVRYVADDKLPKTRPDKYEYIIHSEENCVAHCARLGISMQGCMLVCTHSPCVRCMRLLWQAGVKQVYCESLYKDFSHVMEMKDIDIRCEEVGSDEQPMWSLKYNAKCY